MKSAKYARRQIEKLGQVDKHGSRFNLVSVFISLNEVEITNRQV